MTNRFSIEELEALIAEEKTARAQKVIAECYRKLAALQKEIDELKGETVPSTTKDSLLTIRLTNEELANVKKIAKKEGVTISELVRVRVPEISLSA